MHTFDRLTDEQTDRILIARPRLHSMQHGKNYKRNVHCRLSGYKKFAFHRILRILRKCDKKKDDIREFRGFENSTNKIVLD